MFYVLAHFSKLLTPDSVKLESSVKSLSSSEYGVDNLEIVSFERPDGATVLIVLNNNDQAIPLIIDGPKIGKLKTQISALAIQSYICWN